MSGPGVPPSSPPGHCSSSEAGLVAPIGHDGVMPVLHVLARTAAVTFAVGRRLTAGGVHTGRFLARQVGSARHRGGAGEAGMMRLLDLHAASCAGDTLVAIGLAGTVFFAVPVGQARGRVALYLLMTMLPFALLAPVVGPVLDRFRHGRRGALAFQFGPQWTLRVAMVVFVAGMVIALRLPGRADSQPPETLPRLFQLPGHKGAKVLSGRLVVASLAGSATLRGLYGFLALFL